HTHTHTHTHSLSLLHIPDTAHQYTYTQLHIPLTTHTYIFKTQLNSTYKHTHTHTHTHTGRFFCSGLMAGEKHHWLALTLVKQLALSRLGKAVTSIALCFLIKKGLPVL